MSKATPLRVLMLEDSVADAELTAHALRQAGFAPEWQRVDTRQDYLTHLSPAVDVIFSDYRMPHFNTEEAFHLLQERGWDIPFIILSGAIGEDVAVGLIKQGVTDYLLKDRMARLGAAVVLALKDKKLREENRRAQQALEEKEARYRSLVEAMAQTVWNANPQGETISDSSSWRNYTGQSWEEAKGWGWLQAVHPEDRRMILRAWEKASASKGVYEVEYRVRAADGTDGYFLTRGVPVRNEDGSVREWVGTRANITASKEAELRNGVFSSLGQQLSAAIKPEEAARIIVEVADKLFGWDSCTLDLYLAEQNLIFPLINMDTVAGKRQMITPSCVEQPPTVRMQRIIQQGAELILRDENFQPEPGQWSFGDKARLSASLMLAPVRHGANVIGILSIQSYTPQAYDAGDLATLQALADYCGGALERIRTEQSLHESNERFRQMAENIREIFWLADPVTRRLIYISPAYETIWGRTVESLRQNPDSSLDAILPEDRPLVDAYLQRYKTENCEVEYRIQRPDGTRRYIRDRAFPIRHSSGQILRVAGIAEDVTDRLRAQQRTTAFSSLGERLNSATHAPEAAKIILEVADALFGWDSCYLSLYSAKTQAVRNLLNFDIIDGQKQAVPPTLDNQPSPRMQKVIQHGGQLILRQAPEEPLADLVLFGSGRPSLSIMVVPIRDAGEVVGVMSIQSYQRQAYASHDLVTFQTLADYCGGAFRRISVEEKLSYQADLLAHVHDAIIATDPHGVLTSWNHAAEEMYGWKAEKALGRKFPEIVPVELTIEQQTEMQQALSKTGGCRLEARHRRSDGQTIVVESTTIALRDATGQTTGYVSVNRDVTKRCQLEDQLRQSQKMEAFGQLAGGVAHDFNNLLTVIGGYTSLLLSHKNLETNIREELALVAEATDKASHLTRQLLTFSRKKEMRLASIKLNEVVNNLTKMFQRIIGEEVKLQLVYSPGVPEIWADASMVEQIVLNLAINARDAMLPKGGQLMISTAFTVIGESYSHPEARAGDFVCLSVRDTGCGMAPEVQARIFEPFFTTKGQGKGTGLGLATVYGIVKQHRGWIEVNSQVGFGTTFKVFLPVRGGGNAAIPVAQVEETPRGGHETILLVEDEPGVRSLARQIIQRQGYRVLEAESGPKALPLWQQYQNEISLLLTDMVMPGGMNGRELALNLLQQKPGLKVIYVSGYSVNLQDFEFKEGWDFLQKPYQPQKLVKVIRNRLDEK